MFGRLKKKLSEALNKISGKAEDTKKEVDEDKHVTDTPIEPEVVEEIEKRIEEPEQTLEKESAEDKIADEEQVIEISEEMHKIDLTPEEKIDEDAELVDEVPEEVKEIKTEIIPETKIESETLGYVEEKEVAETVIEKDDAETDIPSEEVIREILESEKEIHPEEPLITEKTEQEKKGFFGRLLGRGKKPSETKPFEPEVETKAKIIEPKIETKEKKGILKTITEKTLSESNIDDILKELENALLSSDVAVEAAERICDDVKKELLGKSVKRSEVENAVKAALKHALLDILSEERIDLERKIEDKDGPFLITVVGFNGTGKTTNLCKLAYKLKKYKPILVAGDTFRAASIEQLEEHGNRLGMKVIKHKYGADSAAVIFDAVKHAQASGAKVILADTAGRSHSNVNLMDEVKKVIRVNKPDITILVLDSLTGNDIYEQARMFNEAVGIDGIILTKADVYEKGGAAISAAFTIKKPILYLGVGQNYEDLKEFNPEEIVKSVLG